MARPPTRSSKKVIYAALAGNLAIALTKAVAAWYTGSAAMATEAVHSLVDTGNEILLLHGLRRASRPPDEHHPLGYGRELYFWSFIVALLIFSLGAGVSVIQGVNRIRNPAPLENAPVAYAVLLISLFFEGTTWRVAFKEFRRVKGRRGYLAAMEESKDPTSFMVLVEDSAAVLGLLLALAGTVASHILAIPQLDGVASVGIGALLAVTAGFLARESKGLLIGERADRALADAVCRLAAAQDGVQHANGLLTVHLAPDQVVAALSIEFADGLSAAELEDAVAAVEQHIKADHPQVITVFVKPETAASFAARRAAMREGAVAH